MSWTSPQTWNVGDVVTAALLNTHLRDNLQALKDVLTGAAQGFGSIFYPTTSSTFYLNDNAALGGPIANFDANDYLFYDRTNNLYSFRIAGAEALRIAGGSGGTLSIANDANFALYKSGGNPVLMADSGDLLWYDRTNNKWHVWVGNADVLTADANGKLGGKGFYDSGVVNLAGSTAGQVLHGLGAAPRFFMGWYTIPATLQGGMIGYQINSGVYFTGATSTQINFTNNNTNPAQLQVYAML